jgi:hypothetical protein
MRTDRIKGGLADNKKASDFNRDQLRKGILVEMEHTNDPRIAEEIAMDHLSENPNYYDMLESVEKGFKQKNPDRKSYKIIEESARYNKTYNTATVQFLYGDELFEIYLYDNEAVLIKERPTAWDIKILRAIIVGDKYKDKAKPVEKKTVKPNPPRKRTVTEGLSNKKMNDEVYVLRRRVINFIYKIKEYVEIPRIEVRITDNHHSVLGRATLKGNVLWITERIASHASSYAFNVIVAHEILHAVFGVEHDDTCPVMKAIHDSDDKRLTDEDIIKIFISYAKKHNAKVIKEPNPKLKKNPQSKKYCLSIFIDGKFYTDDFKTEHKGLLNNRNSPFVKKVVKEVVDEKRKAGIKIDNRDISNLVDYVCDKLSIHEISNEEDKGIIG